MPAKLWCLVQKADGSIEIVDWRDGGKLYDGSKRRFWSCGPHANYCWGREVSEEVWRGVWNWVELKRGLLKLNIGMGIGMRIVHVTVSRAGNYTHMTYLVQFISTCNH